jgi:hypothetical protein
MITKEWSLGVARIANKMRTNAYPLLNNPDYYTSGDVERILSAHYQLQEEWLKHAENPSR